MSPGKREAYHAKHLNKPTKQIKHEETLHLTTGQPPAQAGPLSESVTSEHVILMFRIFLKSVDFL
jgi:hypothetical protein